MVCLSWGHSSDHQGRFSFSPSCSTDHRCNPSFTFYLWYLFSSVFCFCQLLWSLSQWGYTERGQQEDPPRVWNLSQCSVEPGKLHKGLGWRRSCDRNHPITVVVYIIPNQRFWVFQLFRLKEERNWRAVNTDEEMERPVIWFDWFTLFKVDILHWIPLKETVGVC